MSLAAFVRKSSLTIICKDCRVEMEVVHKDAFMVEKTEELFIYTKLKCPSCERSVIVKEVGEGATTPSPAYA